MESLQHLAQHVMLQFHVGTSSRMYALFFAAVTTGNAQ